MAKPPATPSSSDIKGVNRDARVNTASQEHPDPGGALDRADQGSAASPEENAPDERSGG